MRGLVGVTLLVLLGACGLLPPAELPVGGVREEITRENLAAARARMAGGLVEPGWLPEGFMLGNAEYVELDGRVESVDLAFAGEAHHLHIWQTHTSPAELGSRDPVAQGEPIEGSEWTSNPLPAEMFARPGVVSTAGASRMVAPCPSPAISIPRPSAASSSRSTRVKPVLTTRLDM